MNNKLEIYISHYKEYYRYNGDHFKHYFVGNKLNSKNNFMKLPGDDTGDNISDKNENFNEATLLYWVWKNTTQDYVGFSHYRRFLVYNDMKNEKANKILNALLRMTSKSNNRKNKLIDMKLDDFNSKIHKDLEKYDIILPQPSIMPLTLKEQYAHHHVEEHYNEVGKIISEKYPEIYPSFINASNKNTFYIANMFIMKRPLFEEFCEFLFTILFELENRILIPEDNEQKRVFGFISERIFTIFMEYILKERSLKIRFLDFLNTDLIFEQLKSSLIKNVDERYINNKKTSVHIDSLNKITSHHYMLSGWGIVDDVDSINYKIILELCSLNDKKEYNNFESYRNDVTHFFVVHRKKYFDYDSSGFNFLIDTNELTQGDYKIRIRFDNKSSKDSSINFVFNKHIIIDESNNLSIIGGE